MTMPANLCLRIARVAAGLAAGLLIAAAPAGAVTVRVTVPGTSDPWLAGMPPGSRASQTDTAPAQSPVMVSGLPLSGGSVLRFSATGYVSNGRCGPPYCPLFGPDGGIKIDEPRIFHNTGAENGMSTLGAPINALVGVFLDATSPSRHLPPPGLDFHEAPSRDFLSFAPMLRQVFFIGDGFAAGGRVQDFIAPQGATRLFLGTMDGCCWSDNQGRFDVKVSVVPEPSSALLLAGGLAVLPRWLRRRRMGQGARS